MGMPPNCYFTNLDDWTINIINGSPTAVIDNDKLLVEIPVIDPGTILVEYDHILPVLEEHNVTIDVSDYSPDNINDGVNVDLRLYSTVNSDWVRINFFQDTAIKYKVNGYAYISGVTQKNVYADFAPPLLTKIRITRVGTVFYFHYYRSGWVLITNYDAGAAALDINKVVLNAQPRAGYGGSVKLDNLIFKPRLPIRMLQMNQFNGGQCV